MGRLMPICTLLCWSSVPFRCLQIVESIASNSRMYCFVVGIISDLWVVHARKYPFINASFAKV